MSKDTVSELPNLTSSTPDKRSHHRKTSSDLSQLSLIELEFPVELGGTSEFEIKVHEDLEEQPKLPVSTLVAVTETEKLHEETDDNKSHATSVIAELTDNFVGEEGLPEFKVV